MRLMAACAEAVRVRTGAVIAASTAEKIVLRLIMALPPVRTSVTQAMRTRFSTRRYDLAGHQGNGISGM
jgi:hypothetical protein